MTTLDYAVLRQRSRAAAALVEHQDTTTGQPARIACRIDPKERHE